MARAVKTMEAKTITTITIGEMVPDFSSASSLMGFPEEAVPVPLITEVVDDSEESSRWTKVGVGVVVEEDDWMEEVDAEEGC